MNKKIVSLCLILCLGVNFSIASASVNLRDEKTENLNQTQEYVFSDSYNIQWEMNYGSDGNYGARYEGPQPIGDCDNDGKNEMLIAGRDNKIRVFEWDETKQTYLEMRTLFPPLYPYADSDAGGFAIGDLDGDAKNEIGATWGTSVHKFINGKYKTIAYNPWIFQNFGASADCYIGDYDNDNENELIVSGGSYHQSIVPEIVIYKLDNLGLTKEAEWDNPVEDYTYIYMPGVGDVDDDGKNEIVCGSAGKVFVLNWNKNTKKFDEIVIKTTTGDNYPFACVIKDSDGDVKNEIHVGYSFPMFSIFEWNGASFEIKFEKNWPGEGAVIEGVDVGDVDDDGNAELCVGTDVVHIMQWDGSMYVEEAILPTFGDLAVVAIGDCDNDGKNEISAGSVMIDHNQDYMYWVYKFGLEPQKNNEVKTGTGSLKVIVEGGALGKTLKDASVAAWNLETKKWYDIQPEPLLKTPYTRNDLPEGQYLLRALMEGYQIKEDTININAGQETSYTFSLKPTSESRLVPFNNPSNNFIRQILMKIFDDIPFLTKFLQTQI